MRPHSTGKDDSVSSRIGGFSECLTDASQKIVTCVAPFCFLCMPKPLRLPGPRRASRTKQADHRRTAR
jgi:hypothetical protein